MGDPAENHGMSIWKELDQFVSEHQANGADNYQKIFHGPAGLLPGLEYLLIDRLAHLVFVVTYQSLQSEDLSSLVEILERHYPGHFIRIQERGNGPSRDLYVTGTMPEKIKVREGELFYYIHPQRGQNIGFFPDMVKGREKVQSYLAGQSGNSRVLNLFSYTCAFSVATLKAGAGRVDNWDMNRNSLKIGRENHELNGLDISAKQARFFSHDIFKSMGKIKQNGLYDLIIMDPPPFQGGSFSFKRDYPKLIRRTGKWLKPDGAVLFCLNAPTFDWEEFETMIRENLDGEFRSWERVPSPPEFYGRFYDRGLKCFFLTGWVVSEEE